MRELILLAAAMSGRLGCRIARNLQFLLWRFRVFASLLGGTLGAVHLLVLTVLVFLAPLLAISAVRRVSLFTTLLGLRGSLPAVR